LNGEHLLTSTRRGFEYLHLSASDNVQAGAGFAFGEQSRAHRLFPQNGAHGKEFEFLVRERGKQGHGSQGAGDR
jgi:hypothetical protein